MTTAAKTPAEAVAEARARLWKMSREMFHDEQYADTTIDAFAAAVRAEAFEEVRAFASGGELTIRGDYAAGYNKASLEMEEWAKQQAEKERAR